MAEAIEEPLIQLSQRLRFRAVGDEGVLVHLENARVLVVNEVGLYVVQQLGEGAMTLSQLCDAVVAEFEVSRDQARTDVVAFLDQLLEEKAVESTETHDG